MSRLRVYWPDEETSAEGGIAVHAPDVVPMVPAPHFRIRGAFDVVTRARTLYENRCCPTCSYPVVEPIELADGLRNRKGQMIPGTATLVGFRCRGCQAEWST